MTYFLVYLSLVNRLTTLLLSSSILIHDYCVVCVSSERRAEGDEECIRFNRSCTVLHVIFYRDMTQC